jgi:signal transduction histidine kinase
MAAIRRFRPRVPTGIRGGDLVLPSLLAAVGVVEIGAGDDPQVVLGIVSFALAAATLAASRAWPLVVPPVASAGFALGALAGSDVAGPSSWVALLASAAFLAGLYAAPARRRAGFLSVMAEVVITAAAMQWLTPVSPNAVFGLVLSFGPWGLGLALRDALDRNERIAAETERARLEGTLATERAGRAERALMAAELHDVIAHAVGEMVVRTSVAADRIRDFPADASLVLHGIAATGRDALAETGRLLRLVRGDEEAPGFALGDAPGPQPNEAAGATCLRPLSRKDFLPAACFAVVGTIEVIASGLQPIAAWVGGCLLAAATLLVRRSVPRAAPPLVAAFLALPVIVSSAKDVPASWMIAIGLASLAVGTHVPRERAASGLASVLAALGIALVASAPGGSVTLADALTVTLVFAGPWAGGLALRGALERGRAASAAAEREQVRRQVEVECRVRDGRRRLAREVHDVLANSLAVMTVQASLAAELGIRDVDAAAQAIREVETAGRRALEDIGPLIGALAGAGGRGTEPRHGLADLPALADRYQRAGIAVELSLTGQDARVPAAVELSMYRIVQEGLTNALKHAPGSPVSVRLACRDAAVAVEIRNGVSVAPPPATWSFGGHGLLGLRERVSLLGGDLEAGPTHDGGYLLSATIEIPGAGSA